MAGSHAGKTKRSAKRLDGRHVKRGSRRFARWDKASLCVRLSYAPTVAIRNGFFNVLIGLVHAVAIRQKKNLALLLPAQLRRCDSERKGACRSTAAKRCIYPWNQPNPRPRTISNRPSASRRAAFNGPAATHVSSAPAFRPGNREIRILQLPMSHRLRVLLTWRMAAAGVHVRVNLDCSTRFQGLNGRNLQKPRRGAV